MKSIKDSIGMVIKTEKYGNVEVIDAIEEKNWGDQVNIYLDKASVNTCVGSFRMKNGLVGGALIVKKTDKEAKIEL